MEENDLPKRKRGRPKGIPQKPGRKPKGEDKKCMPVQLNFTKSEYALLAREAAARKHSIAQVVRDMVDKTFYVPNPNKDLSSAILIRVRNDYRRISLKEAKELVKDIINKIIVDTEE